MCDFARETMATPDTLCSPRGLRISTLVCVVAMLAMTRPVAAEDAASTAAAPVVSLTAMHSDLKFNLVTSARKAIDAATAGFEEQIRRVAAGLYATSAALYPEATQRIGRFDVFIADSAQVSVLSSATGRIAISNGIADLKPTDDWLALVVAREMGHVLAGHHDDNSTASLVTSILMNLVLPGSGLVKSAISFAGSQVAAVAGRERQTGEADEIAFKLLDASGYTAKSLALNLALGPGDAQLGKSAWAEAFGASSRALIARVRGVLPPTVAVATNEGGVAALALVASANAHSRAMLTEPVSRIAPEAIVVRWRPSGMLGPLILGGQPMPFRRIE